MESFYILFRLRVQSKVAVLNINNNIKSPPVERNN